MNRHRLFAQVFSETVRVELFAVGPFPVNSQEVVKAPSPIFSEILLKLSLPHVMKICKI